MDPALYTKDDALTDDCTWYLASARGKPAGPRLVTLCQEMATEQATLRVNTDKCIAVFQWGGDSKDMDPEGHCPIEENLVSFNAAQNAVETVHSKVIKQKIDPMPLTTGGGYLQRHRAKQMGKAIQGVLDDNNAHAIESDVVMDALVTDHGAGAIMVLDCHDHIKLQHVPIEDVWFDEAETRHRTPRCQYHVPRTGMDLYVALERYANPRDDGQPGFVGTAAERRDAILRAASKSSTWRTKVHTASASRKVEIYEAWHLP